MAARPRVETGLSKKLKGSRKPASETGPPAAPVAPAGPRGAKAAAGPKRSNKVPVKVKKAKGRTGTALPKLGIVGGLSQGLAKLAGRRRALTTLDRLEMAIDEVRLGARDSPRTTRLLGAGIPKMAQKVIEEAGEAAIEAVRGDTVALVNETADLFYNVLVMLGAAGVPAAAVWEEMDRREITLGMAEKLPKVVDPEV